MEVAIHLPDDVAAAVPFTDVPRHILEQLALEGYAEGWLSEEGAAATDVPLQYTLEHLEQDREAHRQLGF